MTQTTRLQAITRASAHSVIVAALTWVFIAFLVLLLGGCVQHRGTMAGTFKGDVTDLDGTPRGTVAGEFAGSSTSAVPMPEGVKEVVASTGEALLWVALGAIPGLGAAIPLLRSARKWYTVARQTVEGLDEVREKVGHEVWKDTVAPTLKGAQDEDVRVAVKTIQA